MKPKTLPNNNVVIYQAKSGAIELRGDITHNTIWATQAQIVQLFDIDQSVVSRHINNIFKGGEVDPKSNMQKMHIANSDKLTIFYALDVILAVGYRANSARAIIFRQWATKVLHQYIQDGYAINKKRIAANYENFLEAVNNIKQLLPTESSISHSNILELVETFADTWLSLDAYDRDELTVIGTNKKSVKLNSTELMTALGVFKQELIRKGEATDIFALEKGSGNIEGIIGNVMQSFGGKAIYPTVEEKAAHLLYFIIKNHPFVDGNKRSGAYAFIWFLKKLDYLIHPKLRNLNYIYYE